MSFGRITTEMFDSQLRKNTNRFLNSSPLAWSKSFDSSYLNSDSSILTINPKDLEKQEYWQDLSIHKRGLFQTLQDSKKLVLNDEASSKDIINILLKRQKGL
jgi:hypothetical protein